MPDPYSPHPRPMCCDRNFVQGAAVVTITECTCVSQRAKRKPRTFRNEEEIELRLAAIVELHNYRVLRENMY